jgi:hypothetical protein
MEIETETAIQFLDLLVIMESSALNIKVYRKPILTSHYLHFQSNQP